MSLFSFFFLLFSCFQTRWVWPNTDRAIQIGSRLVLHSMIYAFFEKTEQKRVRVVGSGIIVLLYTIRTDYGCTLAVMATTGRNQNASGSDPACLQGGHKSSSED